MSTPALTAESCVLRCLLRKYVALKLRENGLCIPNHLLTADGKHVVSHDLEDAFNRAIDMFADENSTALRNMVNDLPATVSTIDECILEAIRNVLTYGDVSWGRMVAVSALIMEVALRCVRNEMPEATVLLIGYTSLLADEKLAFFIRENGGWPAFTHAFHKKHSWLYSCVRTFARMISINALAAGKILANSF
jgi:hypothetical protein